MKHYRGSLSRIAILLLAVAVHGCGGGGGDSTTAPPPPTVTTSVASAIAATSATLNGTVNPNGLATEAWFEWGTSPILATYDNTAKQPFVAGTAIQSVVASLSGLNFGTTYYFRIVASNSSGVTKGTIANFSTSASTPTVTTGSASAITTTTATLNGTVNPNGLVTDAWFEWGQSPTLASFFTTASKPIGSGSAVVPTNEAISGLAFGGTFYFRAAASNPSGTQRGAIQSFSTLNPPPVANAGPDNTVIQGQTATLNGSGSSTPSGTITSYLWQQVAGTTVTLSSNTAVSPTFTAPTVTPVGAVLRFQLTVTDSRSLTASDNVDITVDWGFLDDFSTDTRSSYTFTARILGGTPPAPQFNYDSAGKRVEVITANDLGAVITKSIPVNNSGVFSLDFYPRTTYPTGGGFIIRLKKDPTNYYEMACYDWDNPATPGDLPLVTKVVGGVAVDNVLFNNINNYASQNPPSAYHVTITFTPTVTTVQAFGETIVLNQNATSIDVSQFEIQFNQQDGYIDNLQLVAVP